MNAKQLKHAVKQFFAATKTKNVVPVVNLRDDKNILEGKVAFISGGDGGIGFAIANNFISSGAQVIISGRNETKLKQCQKQLGKNVGYIVLDLEHPENFTNKVNEASEIFRHLDILVNSAGVHSVKSMTDFFSITPDEFDKILGINLKGTYFLSQVVARHMIENKIKGHILNITSSTVAEPAWSPYRLSKLGLEGMTKGLAQKLTSKGIIVNGIAPGSTATNLLGYTNGDTLYTEDNDCNRLILPEEVAAYAKLLVSDLGNMAAGSILYLSGGRGTYDIR